MNGDGGENNIMLDNSSWRDITEFALQKIEQNGLEKQTMKAAEELGELQQECFKALTDRRDDDHIAEEIADVLIMLVQLRLMYGISIPDIDGWVYYKIKRENGPLA